MAKVTRAAKEPAAIPPSPPSSQFLSLQLPCALLALATLLIFIARVRLLDAPLERDEGERERPCAKYPWDGVSSVRPYHIFAKTTTVGVY